MLPRIKSFKPLDGFQLQVCFDDGKCVRYDVMEDIETLPDFKDLQIQFGLFKNARLDASRTCIYWTDQIDLASDTIYEYGKVMPQKTYTLEDEGLTGVAESAT